MKEQNRLVLLNGMGYFLRAAIQLRVQYHMEVVEGGANSCKIGKYR